MFAAFFPTLLGLMGFAACLYAHCKGLARKMGPTNAK